MNMGKPALPNMVWTWTNTSTSIITIENSTLADGKITNGAFEIRIYT